MVPSGPPNPIGSAQTVSPVLLRSNSAILGSQRGSLPQQANYPSVSPQTQYNMNLLGSAPNISSLLNQSLGSGGLNSSLSSPRSFQYGGIDSMALSDPLSIVANDINFASPPSSFAPSNLSNPGSSGQDQNQQIFNPSGNQSLSDQQLYQVQQLESQKYQQGKQQKLRQQRQVQQQQLQYPSFQGGLGSVGPVKVEPQMVGNQNGPQKQLQSLRNLSPVKLEQQQNQIGRGLVPVKLEPQLSDQPMLLQQQFLQMPRQSSQAAIPQVNLLQQQHILQMQHEQQQPQQQRPQLQQQFQQQNLPGRSAVRPVYEPGMCARRLTHYMYQQQNRPDDNNVEFWRKFVSEFFAPDAKKKWCVSLYGSSRQTNGVFPQDVWHCEICNRKPGRGFETTVEVLPRLFKIKYDSGTLEELLYVDMPHEYQNAAGQIVLDYAKAIQESVFEQLRVVRDGQLRIVFSPDLKICSWEFCARRHEELIPRRSIAPQVSHLGSAAQKYQAAARSASCNSSTQELQSNSNMFFASARQLAKALEVPLVNDLGYTKRYVRCLQISEVVNSMKDLIDYSRETGKGPMESLAKFPRRSSSSSGLQNSSSQPKEQQLQLNTGQNLINDNSSSGLTAIQLSGGNGVANGNKCHSTMSGITSVGLLRQNSTNSRLDNQINNPNSPYGGTPAQIPSAGSSTTPPPTQPSPSSPFSSSTPSSSNNLPQTSHNALAMAAPSNNINSASSPSHMPLHQSSQSSDTDPNETQSSVERIIQEIMNSSQFVGAGSVVGVGAVGSSMKNINGMRHMSQNSLGSDKCLVGNGVINNNTEIGGAAIESLGGGIALSATATGIRTTLGNDSVTMIGRVGMPLMPQHIGMNSQHSELNNGLLNDLGEINGFNNLEFDWKSSS